MKVGVNRGPSTLTRLAEGSPTSPCEGEGLARAWPIPTKMEHTPPDCSMIAEDRRVELVPAIK